MPRKMIVGTLVVVMAVISTEERGKLRSENKKLRAQLKMKKVKIEYLEGLVKQND